MIIMYKDIGIVKRNKAVKLIQREWRRVYYNPVYLICKNRLTQEFYILNKLLFVSLDRK